MKKMFMLLLLILSFSAFAEGLTKNEEYISSNDEVIQTQETETQINNEEQKPQEKQKEKKPNKTLILFEKKAKEFGNQLLNDSLTQFVEGGYDFKLKNPILKFGIIEKSFEVSFGFGIDGLEIEANKLYFGEIAGVYVGAKAIDPFQKIKIAPLAGVRLPISENIIFEIEYGIIKTKDIFGGISLKGIFG